MSSRRPALFTILGSFFLLVGLLTTLSVVAGWHFGAALAWQHWAYAALDFLIAYGFFTMQKWLLPLVAATAAANVIFLLLQWSSGGNTGARVLVALCVAAIAYYLYTHRRRLRLNPNGQLVGALGGALWLGIFCYTISILI